MLFDGFLGALSELVTTYLVFVQSTRAFDAFGVFAGSF
jgi:hypothetical protein